MFRPQRGWILCFLPVLLIVACTANADQPGLANTTPGQDSVEETESGDPIPILRMPVLSPRIDDGEPIKVVATTSIVGDIVRQIGGKQINLVILMKPGQDPHSFVSSIGDLRSVAKSDVIFVAGWNLEENLLEDLSSVSDSPQVPVSAGIDPRIIHEETESPQIDSLFENPDPHTWLDPNLVVHWVINITKALTELDPANSAAYQSNAEAYTEKLGELINLYDTAIDTIGLDKRKLVTNHDSLGYFADAYDFEVIGTVIPAASTLSEPSAKELARLVGVMEETGLCTIFGESTTNDQLAEAVAAELNHCDEVHVVSIYTGALGPAESEADTYIKMMEKNLDLIVQSLQ